MESSDATEVAKTTRNMGGFVAEDLETGTLKLSSQEQSEVIKKFQINSQDCGSPEVQIALMTRRLEILAKHFASNPKDNHSKKGMLDIISNRKSLLHYLRHEDVTRYRKTIAALGLRK